MKFSNQIWAFIPARSGSKSIKNKNIIKLNGIHLIGYSIKFSKKIKKVSKTIFSSDSKKYLKIAKKYGCSDLILRKKSLSKDHTSDIEVFLDFVKKLISQKKILPKYFLHLRPTTPIRSLKIVNKAINLFLKNKNKYSALRSVTKMSNPSYKTMKIVNKKLCSIFGNDFNMDKLNKPKQHYPSTYVPNGEIDIVKTENILKKIMHGSKVMALITDGFNSDIDDINDFKIVAKILKKKV